jgi:hypothetical protein
MPAATVGSAYSGQANIERTEKPYQNIREPYYFRELVGILQRFSGLEYKASEDHKKERVEEN